MYRTAEEWGKAGYTYVGRWWYPARTNEEGKVEVYYPTKNPTWQLADTVREELAKRTKTRRKS